MLAKKTSKNQITLPMAVVKQFPDAVYFDVSVEGEAVVLKPVIVAAAGDRRAAVRAKIRALGLTEKSVADSIRWARGRGR